MTPSLIKKDYLFIFYRWRIKESMHDLERENWIKYFNNRVKLLKSTKFKSLPRMNFRKTMAIRHTDYDPVFKAIYSIEKEHSFPPLASPLDKLFDKRFKYLKGE